MANLLRTDLDPIPVTTGLPAEVRHGLQPSAPRPPEERREGPLADFDLLAGLELKHYSLDKGVTDQDIADLASHLQPVRGALVDFVRGSEPDRRFTPEGNAERAKAAGQQALKTFDEIATSRLAVLKAEVTTAYKFLVDAGTIRHTNNPLNGDNLVPGDQRLSLVAELKRVYSNDPIKRNDAYNTAIAASNWAVIHAFETVGSIVEDFGPLPDSRVREPNIVDFVDPKVVEVNRFERASKKNPETRQAYDRAKRFAGILETSLGTARAGIVRRVPALAPEPTE